MSALSPNNPSGVDPTFEAAADATLAQLRNLRDQALAANGLSDDTLQSVIDAGSGWFTSEGKASIAKNLQADAPRIDDLADKYRRWAEAGQRDDGSQYGWGDWKGLADALGSELQTNYGLAWDASVTGPLLSAAGATVEQVGSGIAQGAQALGTAELALLNLLKSPWVWGALIVGGALLFGAPVLMPAVKRAAGALKA